MDSRYIIPDLSAHGKESKKHMFMMSETLIIT